MISFIDLAAQQDRLRSDIEACIARVLAHGQYIMGPEVDELEDKLTAYTGATHCITVANGTDALQIALMGLGVGPGEDILSTFRIVFCGPSCVFTSVLTPRANVNRKEEFAPTRVGTGKTIGANATIVCGHDLGEYCMVAAGAVATKSVLAFALVAGVPATQMGWVSHAGERLGDDWKCPRTGVQYAYDEVAGTLSVKA